MKLSIVSTLYYSASDIYEFCDRLTKSIPSDFSEHEIILVNDGSPDNSQEIALKAKLNYPEIKIIELSRNFGHHKAIMTGLEYANGDFIFLIDSDLEEPPELLTVFWGKLQSNMEYDVVFGVQNKRKGGWYERITGKVFYSLFNFFSDHGKIEKNFLTIRLMKRKFIDELVKIKDQEFYFAPANSFTGFKKLPVVINKLSSSKTTYKFSKKFDMLLNSILSNSSKPLSIIFYTGILITLFSIFLGLYYLRLYLMMDIGIDGWTTIILLNTFFGGIIILFLGIIALYISKIFNETKKRPFTIIKKIY